MVIYHTDISRSDISANIPVLTKRLQMPFEDFESNLLTSFILCPIPTGELSELSVFQYSDLI